MGRKQRAKLERKAKGQAVSKPIIRSDGYGWVKWVLGVALVMVLILGAMVWYVQGHKAHFMKVSVISDCADLQKKLDSQQGNFTLDDSNRLRLILDHILQMTNQQKVLDEKIGAHFMFVLRVMSEILEDGKLQPNELDKMEMLVNQAQKLLEEHKPK